MKKRKKETKNLLYIKLDNRIVEDEASINFFSKNKIPLRTIFEGLKKAVKANEHDLVLIRIEKLDQLGWATLESLRRAFIQLKNENCKIYAYLEGGSLKEYYMASLANEIFFTPSGTLDLTGIQGDVFFFKEILQKAGVRADIIKTGDHKTFGDIFTRNSMSEAHRAMMEKLLEDLLKEIIKAIQISRPNEEKSFRELIDIAPFTANEALEHSIVDELMYEEELEDYFKTLLDTKKLNKQPLLTAFSQRGWKQFLSFKGPKKIAIIYASGNIVEESPKRGIRPKQNFISTKPMLKAIRKARESKKIKAIVLRVNSPGGSALTSDIIWHEIIKAKEKKPVIVSMGNVAASGGYYISMGSDKIFSEAMTVTGSIGVISGKFIASGLLEKLGIQHESVSFGKNTGIYSPFEAFTDDMREKLKNQVHNFYYKIFLDKASSGRNIPLEDLKELAGGRVWSGITAKENSLVDSLGGLAEAIDEAKKRTGLENEKNLSYSILPKKKISFGLSTLLQEEYFPESSFLSKWLNQFELFKKEEALYLFPYDLDIH